MKDRYIFLLCLVALLIFIAGCGDSNIPVPENQPPSQQQEQQQREDPPTQPEAPTDAEEPQDSLPVIEIEPIIVEEPELQEPLWNSDTEVSYLREIQRSEDTVRVFETDPEEVTQLRLYEMENGDRVTMGRMKNAVGTLPLYIWELPAGGNIRWYDREIDQWQLLSLNPGEFRASMIELTMEDSSSYLIYLPKTYRMQEHEVMEYLPEHDGTLSVTKIGNSWRFTLLCSLPDENCVSDFIMAQGHQPMLNWDHYYCGELWKNYTMETEGKWCFDGYYWPCPDNYTPSDTNYLYRCPASYLVHSIAHTASVHQGADYLALAMLDTLALQQNDDGFWPTTPQSEWLYTDYGTEYGFYDTRFNTDLIKIYRKYYRYTGGNVLRKAIDKYLAFFIDFAEQEHFTSASGGWFIPDYAPAPLQKPHASLNHQIAECIELYHLADILQRPELEELADKMLLAVSDTMEQWINPDGDLYYCVFPDGTFGMKDYPYLTYNDLYDLQLLLTERRGQKDDTLQFLMDQKKLWMDANGITGYSQS